MTTSPLNARSPRFPVLELFESLGYDLDPVNVDVAEWARSGFDLRLGPGDALVHLGRVDEVELLSLTARDSSAAVRILDSYRSFNRILRPLVALERSSEHLELWGWAGNGKPGRLDVSLTELPAEVSRRLDLLASRPCRDLGARLEVALNRESISERFFRGFSSGAGWIIEELGRDGVPENDAREWAVLFLSRILFLFFIQEKGWLDGDRSFLLSRSLDSQPGSSRYRSFFEPLFFDCLNERPARRGAAARRLGRIPYLNGGLFKRSPIEERHPGIALSDGLVTEIIREVFARFPFTIREDDHTAVAIDPEMLGHVFESLMEESERTRSGSFYTPKPVVEHLVGRAVRTWLGSDADVNLETASGAERKSILKRLSEVRVLDPACGSGAFLLAALREIERLRIACGDPSAPEALRQEIVERSLFGVDLKREAVQLCELRLWLAIVAARPSGVEAIGSIQPLPNLDRNILQGNSLLDPVGLHASQRLSVYRSWSRGARERNELTETYRHATGDRRRNLYQRLRESDLLLGRQLLEEAIANESGELERIESQGDLFGLDHGSRSSVMVRQHIAELEAELEKIRRGEIGFFSYDLHFNPVMEQGGFDLVVGNPPWVRGSNLPPTLRRALRERYEWLRDDAENKAAFPQFELSVLFLEKATAITKAGGGISMLVPGKILKAFYARRCRQELVERHTLCAIDDWSRDGEMFDADTFPVGLTFAPESREQPVEIVRNGETWTASRDSLELPDRSGVWALLPGELVRSLRSVWRRHAPLSAALSRMPVMGVKTGANRIFFLEQVSLDRNGALIRDGLRVPWRALTRCIRGRDVRRWKAEDSTWMIWPEDPGTDEWKREFAAARGIPLGQLRLAYVRPEHLGWKVVWKDVATRLEAVVVPDSVEIRGHRVPLLPNQTLYCLDAGSIDESHLHAAILNSTLVSALAAAVAEPAKDGHYRFFARTVARIPWPEVDLTSEIGRKLVRLSRAAHCGGKVQDQIDELVCELYGVRRELLASLARWI